jgi:hypothetical protein
LRNHLFSTIESLQDDEKPMPIDRAKAICEVADRLIDTAKVEVQARELLGDLPASKFLGAGDLQEPSRPALMPKRVV